MKHIRLISLELHNFKGIKSLVVPFDVSLTKIWGANATGKTTIYDAFAWTLFGKDSQDRKDFSIKTIQINGKPKAKLEHSVIATLAVGSETITLKRVYKEKWVTKRGSEEAEFSGHETSYFWNEVPMQQKEYEDKVAEIFPESTFKLISSPFYFNTVLKWNQRRDLLFELAGNISVLDVAAGNKDFVALIQLMETEKKTLDELKRQYASRKKLLKKSLEEVPSRIDEVERSKPLPIDEKTLKEDIERYENEIDGIQESIMDAAKAATDESAASMAISEEIREIRQKLSDVEKNVRQQHNKEQEDHGSLLEGKRGELRRAMSAKDRIAEERSELEAAIAKRATKVEALRVEWAKINESSVQISEDDTACPTCRRQYEDADDIRGKLVENYNAYKTKALADLSKNGKELNVANEKDKAKLAELAIEFDLMNKQVIAANKEVGSLMEKCFPALMDQLESNDLYKKLKGTLAILEISLANRPRITTSDVLDQRRKELVMMLDNSKHELTKVDRIKSADTRIKELLEEEKGLAQQIADLEKAEFTIESFIRRQIDIVEENINGRFQQVSFKLFEDQINGGTKETCEALIKGVPYSDANTGHKILAGVDICNTFAEHYQYSAPLFVDHKESITSDIDSCQQLVLLVASEAHKTLTIN